MRAYITRKQEGELRARAAERPCVIVTGARQCGKTTMLTSVFPDTEYVSFDSILLAASASDSPDMFLDKFPDQVILDEIQYVPGLFRALKTRIDAARDLKGRFLLTGSQTFELMKGISESLAGRIGLIRLETLSAQELVEAGRIDADSLRLIPIRGGYPELWRDTSIEAGPWFEDYIRTYIERDLKELVRIRDLLQFRRMLAIAANRTGQLINYADMGRACGVSLNTVKSWVSALEVSGIIHILPPWYTNSESRLIKSPKLYFSDTGLLCALLDIRHPQDLEKSIHAGAVWENFVFTELVKSGGWEPGRTLFFYRDHAGNEVDFLGTSGGNRILVEAKYSQRVRPERLGFEAAAAVIHKAPTDGDSQASRIMNYVASPIGEKTPLPFKDFSLFDPRLGGSPGKSP